MKFFESFNKLKSTTCVEERPNVTIEWRFRSWFLDKNNLNERENNEIEQFINECSSDGLERITIENFESRTTIWANHVEEDNPPLVGPEKEE
jgi:hypothetical protein